jgi:hypothetical protein
VSASHDGDVLPLLTQAGIFCASFPTAIDRRGQFMDDSIFGPGFFIGMVIAAVIGVLIGKDAQSRGMSGMGWGIFSFLVCIIAVPLYLVVRKPRLDERK